MLLGVSFDSPTKNAAFKANEKFEYPLWSDLQRELALYYGAAKSASTPAADRVTVLLNPAGEAVVMYGAYLVNTTIYAHPGNVLKDCKALVGQ